MEQPPIQPPYNQPPQQPALSAGGFDSPFEVAGGAPQTPPPAAPSPFELAPEPVQATPDFPVHQPVQPAQPASPFESAPVQAPVQQAPVPPSGPIPTPNDPESLDLPPGALEDPREFVELNVTQLLGSVPPQDLGVAGVNVSPFAVARIPMAMLKPQLPTGQVFLNVSDVIVGCKPEHRATLAGCNPMVRVKVPIALIFPSPGSAVETSASAGVPEGMSHQSPMQETVPSAAQAPQMQSPLGTPAPFATDPAGSPTGFGAPAAECPNGQQSPPQNPPQQLPPSPFDDSPPAQMPALGALPSLGATIETPTVPALPPTPQESEVISSPLSALPPLGGISSQPVMPPAEAPATPSENAPQLPPMMPANGGLAPTALAGTPEISTPEPPPQSDAPVPSDGGGWPFDPTKIEAPSAGGHAVESLEDLAPIPSGGDPVAPQGFTQPPAGTAAQQALRGLFLTDGKLSPSSVVEHCVGLPGIASCIVLGRDGQLSAKSEQSGSFADDAPRIHRSLVDLSSATGASSSEALTIRTSDAMVSFFSGDGLSIGVKHESQGFRPGVSERLTLIAQQLGQLDS